MTGGNQFTAAAAALGYAYQFRYALLLAMGRQQTGLGWTLAIEAADDIELGRESGDDAELLQLKHRAPGTVLTDGSPDLWKTLRVWSTALAAGSLASKDSALLLVTTASVSPGSVCEQLVDDPSRRDAGELARRLAAVAEASENEALRSAHAAFLALTEEQRLDLLTSVRVVPAAPNVIEVDERIRALARLAVRGPNLESFVTRLEGWWNRRCLRQLAHGLEYAVRGDEFDGFLSDLREQFQHDNLPVDDDVAAERPEIEAFLNRLFVRQLDLVGVGGTRLLIAVRDYHRAFVQRSRWSEEGLLEYGELDRYERRLREAWEITFERTRDELGDEATDDLKAQAAKAVYAWAEAADFPIRAACGEGFISRGSFHMLADVMQVGWHPEFELRLAGVLEEGAVR